MEQKKEKMTLKRFLKEYILSITFFSSFLIAGAVCGLCLLVYTVYMGNIAFKNADAFARTVSTTAYDNFNANFSNMRIMEEYMVYTDGNINREKFDQIAKRMMKDNSVISTVAFAKDNTVTYVYPYEGNSSFYGYNFTDDVNTEQFKTNTANDKFYIRSDFKIRNELSIIGLLPIYVDLNHDNVSEYWGLAVIVLDPDKVFSNIQISIDDAYGNGNMVSRVAVIDSLTDKEYAVAESEKPFKGNSDSFGASFVSTDINGLKINAYAAPYITTSDRLYLTVIIVGIILLSTIVGLLYVDYRKVISDKLNRELEENREIIKKQSKDVKETKDLVDILATDFDALCLVNLDEDSFDISNISKNVMSNIGEMIEDIDKYSAILNLYVSAFITEEYAAKVSYGATIANLKQELRNKKSFAITYQTKSGNFWEARYIKMSDVKEEPHIVVLSFANRDDEIRQTKEYEKSLHEARDRAEAASLAKSEFLFSMSHDIRTPMNAIVGFTNMAEKYIDDKDKVHECLTNVQSSSRQLLGLINDILDMSRIESGNVTIEKEAMNLRESLSKFFEIMMFSAEQKSLDLTLNYSCDHDEVLCDDLRLNRILMNTVGNSIKYTNAGGYINLSVEEEESKKENFAKYVIKVKDNGIGMSKEFLEHIFDSFSREQTSTTSGIQGTGLGMSITKKLVDMMGGEISVESEYNVGTTVTITFELELTDLPIHRRLGEEEIDMKLSLQGKRVLLVEDNQLNRDIAKDTLEEEGIIVEEATDGSEAVSMIAEHKDGRYYDIVLMDIQMPYMDGYKATRAIREMTDVQDVDKLPIIAMTANAFDEDKKKAFEAGMNDHLAKPLDIHLLKKTLLKYI